jgi:hypothetical protein
LLCNSQAPLQNRAADWTLGSKGCYNEATLQQLQQQLAADITKIADGNAEGCLSLPVPAEVLAELPQCAFVYHDVQGGGYMLDVNEMVQYTRDNRSTDQPIDYSSNVYSTEPPAGGADANRLDEYISWLNQSAWVYDPLYQSWWRYVDNADPDTAGVLHSEVDRLTGRQLHFENVIVLYAEHEVISPTNLRIHLEQDWVGDADLFRDGKKYDIRWSTVASEEEVQSGRR